MMRKGSGCMQLHALDSTHQVIMPMHAFMHVITSHLLTPLRHHAVWQRSHGYFLGYKPDIISAVRFGQESDYDGSRAVPPPPITPIPDSCYAVGAR